MSRSKSSQHPTSRTTPPRRGPRPTTRPPFIAHCDGRIPLGPTDPGRVMAQMRLAVGTEAILRAAVSYLRRGWAVVPVKHKTKRPVIAGWPQLRLSESDLAQHFGCVQKNIGLVLGESSAG